MAQTASRSPVAVCPRCNQLHITFRGNQSCTAHRTRRNPDGNLIPCTQAPCRGLKVCVKHGGNTSNARAQRAKLKAEAATLKSVQIFGVPRQVDPAQGLIEEYWRRAGLVSAYERVVSGLPIDDLVWGVVERATTARRPIPPPHPAAEPRSGEGGSERHGQDEPAEAILEARTVSKGAMNVWVQLFNEERDRFAKLGVEIVKLGLEARRDEYIRAQVEVFASVLLAPELALTMEQRRVAGRLLRGLGAAQTAIIDGEATS